MSQVFLSSILVADSEQEYVRTIQSLGLVTSRPSTDLTGPVPPLDLCRGFPALGLAVELHLLPLVQQEGVALLGLDNVGLARLTVDTERGLLRPHPSSSSTHLALGLTLVKGNHGLDHQVTALKSVPGELRQAGVGPQREPVPRPLAVPDLVGHAAGEPGLGPLGHGGVGGVGLNVLPGGEACQGGRYEEREEHVERDLHAGDQTESRDCATLCLSENSCSVHVAASGVAGELR